MGFSPRKILPRDGNPSGLVAFSPGMGLAGRGAGKGR